MGLTPTMKKDFGDRVADHGEPIQMLAPTGPSFQIVSEVAQSNRTASIGAGRLVSIWADNNTRFRFGDVTVVAADDNTSDPLTNGQREYYHMGTATHIAARARAGEVTGIFYVRVLE